LDQAAEWLRQAERPFILAGRGVVCSGAEAVLRQLAERIGSPVATTCLGKGVLPESHRLSARSGWLSPGPGWPDGGPMRPLWDRADLVLVIGTDLGELETSRWSLPLPGRSIQIDIDPSSLGKNYPIGVPLLGDARTTIERLLDILGPGNSQGPATEIGRVRQAAEENLRNAPGWRAVAAAHRALGDEAVIVGDAAEINWWFNVGWPSVASRGYIFPYSSAALGFGLPAGLGPSWRPQIDRCWLFAGTAASSSRPSNWPRRSTMACRSWSWWPTTTVTGPSERHRDP